MAGREIREGDTITIDGASGEVMAGEVATISPELSGDFGTLMAWADGVRRMRVRANAETPADARALPPPGPAADGAQPEAGAA